jgi:regulatory protein
LHEAFDFPLLLRLCARRSGTMTSVKKPRKITERSIENAALFYLQRFATSAENLKRVLMRKVHRSARIHGAGSDGAAGNEAVENGARIVDGVIGRLQRAGLLDDHKYAEARAMTLHRRGMSAGRIRVRLVQKGVDTEAAQRALMMLAAETAADLPGADPSAIDLAGAVNLTRRRRLGPFRSPADRPRMREKDLATLARSGFSYPLAVKVIDAACPDTLMDST